MTPHRARTQRCRTAHSVQPPPVPRGGETGATHRRERAAAEHVPEDEILTTVYNHSRAAQCVCLSAASDTPYALAEITALSCVQTRSCTADTPLLRVRSRARSSTPQRSAAVAHAGSVSDRAGVARLEQQVGQQRGRRARERLARLRPAGVSCCSDPLRRAVSHTRRRRQRAQNRTGARLVHGPRLHRLAVRLRRRELAHQPRHAL